MCDRFIAQRFAMDALARRRLSRKAPIWSAYHNPNLSPGRPPAPVGPPSLEARLVTPGERARLTADAPTPRLAGRGIDIERVNIVVNYDMPEVSDTYLHRVGRAGRFGTKGLAITFVSSDEDAKTLEEVQSRFEVSITQLPESIDVSSYMTA